MKTSDFKTMMAKVADHAKGKRLAVYRYATFATFTDDGINIANALGINFSSGSNTVKIDCYQLYDLKPNKHGGNGYSDSKTLSSGYYDLTFKQKQTLVDFLHAKHEEAYDVDL